MREGNERLASGEFDAALRAFEAASNEILFEVPNYEVLVRIAEVRCRRSDREIGMSILKDFRCMLAIDSGRIPCYLGSTAADLRTRNPQVSSECFRRMCGEMYLPYYDEPSTRSKEVVQELTAEADRVEKVCSEGQ